ncbi:hypothetical protein PG984_013975 [Apiospora sp. TS-2023a]
MEAAASGKAAPRAASGHEHPEQLVPRAVKRAEKLKRFFATVLIRIKRLKRNQGPTENEEGAASDEEINEAVQEVSQEEEFHDVFAVGSNPLELEGTGWKDLPNEMRLHILKILIMTPEFVHFRFDPAIGKIQCPNRDRLNAARMACKLFKNELDKLVARSSYEDTQFRSAVKVVMTALRSDDRESVKQRLEESDFKFDFEDYGWPASMADGLRDALKYGKTGLPMFEVHLLVDGKDVWRSLRVIPDVELFYFDRFLNRENDEWLKYPEEVKSEAERPWEHRVRCALFPLFEVRQRLLDLDRYYRNRRPLPINQAAILKVLFRSLSEGESELDECKILVGPYHPFLGCRRQQGVDSSYDPSRGDRSIYKSRGRRY